MTMNHDIHPLRNVKIIVLYVRRTGKGVWVFPVRILQIIQITATIHWHTITCIILIFNITVHVPTLKSRCNASIGVPITSRKLSICGRPSYSATIRYPVDDLRSVRPFDNVSLWSGPDGSPPSSVRSPLARPIVIIERTMPDYFRTTTNNAGLLPVYYGPLGRTQGF